MPVERAVADGLAGEIDAEHRRRGPVAEGGHAVQHGAEHPAVDARREVEALRGRQEAGRRHQRAVDIDEAQQHFGMQAAGIALQRVDALGEQREAAFVQRPLQPRGPLRLALPRLDRRITVEPQVDAVAALLLRGEAGRVRRLQHRLRRRESGIDRGEADAGADAEAVAVVVEAVDLEAVADLLGDPLALLGRAALQQHGELIAPQARQQVAGPHRVTEQARDLLQQLVAGGMAAGVVDDLELVEVDVHERVRRVAARGVRQGFAQPGLELLAVVQAGQRVVRGAEAHLDAEPALFGDVVEHQHGAQQGPVGIADRGGGVLDAVFAAIARQQQGLWREPDHAALPQAGGDRIPRRLAGLLVDDPEDLRRGQTLRLVARPAGQALRHGIQPGHVAADVGGDHRVTDRLQGDLQQFALAPQVGLGEALRRHVPIDADEARGPTIARRHRADRGAQVADAAVRPHHAELDAGRRFTGDHAAQRRQQRRAVLGVEPLDPVGISHGLAGGRATVLAEHPVVPVRLVGADIDVPDAEMAGVDGERHAFAGVLDGETLGALGGDVLERPDEPDHPIPLEHRAADRARPEGGAVPAEQGQFEIPWPPVAEAGLDGGAHGVAGLGRVEADRLVDGRHEVVGQAVQQPRHGAMRAPAVAEVAQLRREVARRLASQSGHVALRAGATLGAVAPGAGQGPLVHRVGHGARRRRAGVGGRGQPGGKTCSEHQGQRHDGTRPRRPARLQRPGFAGSGGQLRRALPHRVAGEDRSHAAFSARAPADGVVGCGRPPVALGFGLTVPQDERSRQAGIRRAEETERLRMRTIRDTVASP